VEQKIGMIFACEKNEKKMLILPKKCWSVSLVGVIVNVTIMVIVNMTIMVIVNVTITHTVKTRSYIFEMVNQNRPEFFFKIVVDYGCDYVLDDQ
jgi:hypothetical protein